MKNNRNLNYILESIKPFKFWIGLQFIIGIIWAIDLSLSPYILKIMIDILPHLNSENVVSELSGPVIFYLSLIFIMEKELKELYDQ